MCYAWSYAAHCPESSSRANPQVPKELLQMAKLMKPAAAAAPKPKSAASSSGDGGLYEGLKHSFKPAM